MKKKVTEKEFPKRIAFPPEISMPTPLLLVNSEGSELKASSKTVPSSSVASTVSGIEVPATSYKQTPR